MNDYTKGILTGASLILCFFMLVSAKSQSKNLGDITVNSVTVVNENGKIVGLLESSNDTGALMISRAGYMPSLVLVAEKSGGTISTFNADDKETAYLGTADGGGGLLKTSNADGKQTAYLGTGEGSAGILKTSNADGKMTTFLGSGEGSAGALLTYNAEGQTAYLGDGVLRTFNKHGVESGYFGTNKDNDGMAVLFDRYGDIGWSASGKK